MSYRQPQGIRIKVSRAELIKAVKEKVAECDREYEKALKRYHLKLSQWPKKTLAALEEAKKVVRGLNGDLEDSLVMRKFPYGLLEFPEKPEKPSKPEGGARLLRMLEMGSDETVSLSEAQFKEYMESCRR